jgi:arylsulfatase A-like enzyme
MERRALYERYIGFFDGRPAAGCGLFKIREHGQAAGGGHASKQPNIIFLLTDDQRWDSLGCVNPILRTPNIDAMAADGVIFTNAYVTTAICCTSRASFLTGQYARRHGIVDFNKQFTDEQLAGTYPMLMKQSGYRVGFVGKYGVGARDLPAASYDFWRGWAGQGKYDGHTDANGQPIHLTRLMGNQSLEFLDTCTTRQPFCLSVSFKAPHCQDGDPRQFIYDPQHEAVYKDVTFPLPKTATEADWQRLPEFLKTNNEARARWEIRFSTPEKYQAMVRNYHRLIYGVDVEVGRIRRKLQEKGWPTTPLLSLPETMASIWVNTAWRASGIRMRSPSAYL